MIFFALVVAGTCVDGFRDPPGVVARIGSPEFHHPRYASILGLSTDGERLYTAEPASFNSANAGLFVWETATGRLRARYALGRDSAGIHAIGFGPEGVRVLERIESGWQYRLRIVNPDTGATIRTGETWKEPPKKSFGGGGFGEAWYNFSPDAAWMIRPADKGYSLLNTTTGAETVIDLGKRSISFGGDGLFSPNGRVFCTADKTRAQLYELPSGKHLGDIANSGDEQYPIAFTPSGQQLLLWTRHAKVWSLDAWDIAEKKRHTILGERALPGRVHIAPDGKRYALVPGSIGSYHPAGDWEIRDLATGAELGRVPAAGYTSRAFFSPNGRTLYTQPGNMVVPWDIATGKPARAAPAILGPIDRFRFTPDGKIVGLAGGFVYTWEPVTAEELARKRIPGPIDWYGAAAFNLTADRLHFTGVGDRLVAWGFRTGAIHESPLELQRLPNSAVELWFTPDGSFHVEYRYDNALLILRDPATGKQTARVTIPEAWRQYRGGSGVHGLALSPDGRRLAIGGDVPSTPGDQKPLPSLVAMLNVDGSGKAVICESAAQVRAVAFSPDGRFLVGTLREQKSEELGVWNAVGRHVATIQRGSIAGRVNSLRFSPDGRVLAVSHGRHEIQLVETASWQVRAQIHVPGWESDGYFGYDRSRDVIAWSAEGRRLATAVPDGGLVIWDTRKLGTVKPITTAADAERAWSAIAGTNAKAAFMAIRALVEAPDRAVPLFRSKVAPVAAPDAAKLKAMIAALGSEEFAERERASEGLRKLDKLAEPALRAARRATQSPEVVQRTSELLDRLALAQPTRAELCAARAVEIAEWIGMPEAVKLLDTWSRGADGARLTTEARAALARLKMR